MKNQENNKNQMMKKVYCIIEKSTDEIISFSTEPNTTYNEWDDYYKGTDEENTHVLQQTFMSEKQIRIELGL